MTQRVHLFLSSTKKKKTGLVPAYEAAPPINSFLPTMQRVEPCRTQCDVCVTSLTLCKRGGGVAACRALCVP